MQRPYRVGRDPLLKLFDTQLFHPVHLLPARSGPPGIPGGLAASPQLPCDSAVLLPGCGVAPFDTSLPWLPLLSPGTPLTLSGAMRCSSSSIVNALISRHSP